MSPRLIEPGIGPVLLTAAAHYHQAQRWHVRLFLLMPDHLHALISFPRAEDIQDCWRDWKRFTAKKTDVVWQRDFFEHRIRHDESWELKADYVRENPVRKGLIVKAEDWPWVFVGS